MVPRKGATSCPSAMAVAASPIRPPFRVCSCEAGELNMPHNCSIIWDMRGMSEERTSLVDQPERGSMKSSDGVKKGKEGTFRARARPPFGDHNCRSVAILLPMLS